MSLTKSLEQIVRLHPLASEDVDSGPIETLAARRGRKRNAQEEIKRETELYTQELLRSAMFIVTTGEKAEQFAGIAVSRFDCFSAEADEFYEKLANRVHPSVYQNEGGAGLLDVVSRHLEDMANEMGIIGYPQLIFKAEYRRAIKTKDDFVGLLKQAINDRVGAEIAGIYAVRSIVANAISKMHVGPVTPIIMTTSDEKLLFSLLTDLERLTPRVFLVVAGKAPKHLKSAKGAIVVKDPSDESVEQALTAIRNNLKK